jgi:hypothetical protein
MNAIRMTIVVAAAATLVVLGQVDANTLGQGPPPDVDVLARRLNEHTGTEALLEKMVSVLGPLGFLGWYCYYVTSRVLPAKDQQVKEDRESFQTALIAQRDSYRAELKSTRDHHEQVIASLVAQLREQNATVLEMIRSCTRQTGPQLPQG